MKIWVVKELYFRITSEGRLDLPEDSDFEALEGFFEYNEGYKVYGGVSRVCRGRRVLQIRSCDYSSLRKFERLMTEDAVRAMRNSLSMLYRLLGNLDIWFYYGEGFRTELASVRIPVVYDDYGLVEFGGNLMFPKTTIENSLGLAIIVDSRLPLGFTFIDRRRGCMSCLKTSYRDGLTNVLPYTQIIIENEDNK